MEDRTAEKQKHPVLVGVTHCQCGCGAPNLVLDINGQRAVMNIDETLIVFNQIGALLEGFGVFDDEPDALPLTEGSKCLH